MPLSWSTLPDSQLCIVSGEGTVTRSDIDTYLAGTIGEGAKGYAKLVDITACTLALDADDLDMASAIVTSPSATTSTVRLRESIVQWSAI